MTEAVRARSGAQKAGAGAAGNLPTGMRGRAASDPAKAARRAARGPAFPWTTPADLKAQLDRLWQRGDIPRALIEARAEVQGQAPSQTTPAEQTTAAGQAGLPLPVAAFPLEISVKRPSARELAERFGDVMEWVDTLREESRPRRGFGYELRWQAVKSRVHGANHIPAAAVFPTPDDALRFLGRESDAARLRQLAGTILAQFPALSAWVLRRPLQVLAHQDKWDQLLAVLLWFVRHPRPGLYLRQLDVPGVDTKFIEAHRGLVGELLDLVLPPWVVDALASSVTGFAARYGLRQEAPLIRFRLLDTRLHIKGLTDLAVLPEEFARLDTGARRVFITENRTNGLAFPAMAGSIVIFGLGYGAERLGDVPWLQQCEVWYWGDIDTHGFGILNRLRAVLPHVRSFLMDRETLMAHRSLWVREPDGKRYDGEPTRLTTEEYTLFDDLRRDLLGPQVRLEQERIRWGWLELRLAALPSPPARA